MLKVTYLAFSDSALRNRIFKWSATSSIEDNNILWYDDIVVATQYIGPVAESGSPTLQ